MSSSKREDQDKLLVHATKRKTHDQEGLVVMEDAAIRLKNYADRLEALVNRLESIAEDMEAGGNARTNT